MCMHFGANTAIHIAQITRNEAIHVRVGASLAASSVLKERASKPARVEKRKLAKAAASRTP